jgi:hypothetical protein
MPLTETVWRDSNADADGEAPFGHRDHLAWVAGHFVFLLCSDASMHSAFPAASMRKSVTRRGYRSWPLVALGGRSISDRMTRNRENRSSNEKAPRRREEVKRGISRPSPPPKPKERPHPRVGFTWARRETSFATRRCRPHTYLALLGRTYDRSHLYRCAGHQQKSGLLRRRSHAAWLQMHKG